MGTNASEATSHPTVYTIGHSRHEIDRFLLLLRQFDVNCIIDVRSSPYSAIAPQFNKDSLRASLKAAGILYAHFEHEFGARRQSPSLWDEDGRVDFDKVRATAEFRRGVARLGEAVAKGFTVSLMCSEGDPFDCHRFSMVSYQLKKDGYDVRHILPDGTYRRNEQLEQQLLKKYRDRLPQSTLFEAVSDEARLELAYRLRGRDVAYNARAKESQPTTALD